MEFPENPIDFIKDHQRNINGIRKTDNNDWTPEEVECLSGCDRRRKK